MYVLVYWLRSHMIIIIIILCFQYYALCYKSQTSVISNSGTVSLVVKARLWHTYDSAMVLATNRD